MSATGPLADTNAVTTTKAPNTLLLWLIALIAAGALITAIIAIVLTAKSGAWLTLAFQCTIVLASILGLLQGFRKFSEAPSIAAACIAGTFFVAGFLGYMGAGGTVGFRTLLSGDLDAFNPGKLPTWILLADIGSALFVGAIAGLFALGRSPKESWKQLVLGALLGAPVLLGSAAAYKLHLASRIASLNMIIATLIVVIVFILFIGLIAASANAFIKAFAAGLPDLDAPSAPQKTQPGAKPKANTASTAS